MKEDRYDPSILAICDRRGSGVLLAAFKKPMP